MQVKNLRGCVIIRRRKEETPTIRNPLNKYYHLNLWYDRIHKNKQEALPALRKGPLTIRNFQ